MNHFVDQTNNWGNTMKVGYCHYERHPKWLNKKDVKEFRCRCKCNTHEPCRYFEPIVTKEQYKAHIKNRRSAYGKVS